MVILSSAGAEEGIRKIEVNGKVLIAMTPETFEEFLLINNELEAEVEKNEVLEKALEKCEKNYEELVVIATDRLVELKAIRTTQAIFITSTVGFFLLTIGGIFIW